MGKTIPIDVYFKRKSDKISEVDSSLPTYHVDTPISPTSTADPPFFENPCIVTQRASHRLRVQTSIRAAHFLATHGIAFGGHDESLDSLNSGVFLGMITLMAECNEKIAEAVLNNAPQNDIYTSPLIQKEILHVFASIVKKVIREEIGDAKYSIIVDEVCDESRRDQMSIVLRFVDNGGLVRERFIGLVHVSDTDALNLKNEIYSVLSYHHLEIRNIRGQSYDGGSIMRGEWNELQALISRDCPYAYYVHCLAHHLQLALVTASKEVFPIFYFFERLTYIIKAVGASCKQSDDLKAAKAGEIEFLIGIDEFETVSGLNQVAGDIHWSSHLKSVSSLLEMFSPTCEVLLNIIDDGITSSDRGTADSAYESLISFEFVFILHLMKEILEITDILCQALQCKSQDVQNVIHLLLSTKDLLQKLKEERFDGLLVEVKSFCVARTIDVPDMSARYILRRGRARHHLEEFTVEHYYRGDIFYAAIDTQLLELNSRFNGQSMELIALSSSLDPWEHVSFRMNDICQLVDKFYPQDFTDQEKIQLKMQLSHYKLNVVGDPDFHKLSSISALSQWLVKTKRSIVYHLVYRMIVLVLTLPISIATIERSFSAMNIIKTQLLNEVDSNVLSDASIVYIEREIALKLDLESIVDDFCGLKENCVPL